MKKILALVLTVVMAASLAACGNSGTKETQAPASGDSETAAESTAAESTGETAEKVGEGVDVKDLKVGFIFIGDENEGYTAAHYAGAKGMQEALGLSDDQIIIKWNIPEDETCYDAAVDLADHGCNIVFANSFGHESYILQRQLNFRMYSSVMQQGIRQPAVDLPICTTTLHLSMNPVMYQVS